jgi:hypothetical protein
MGKKAHDKLEVLARIIEKRQPAKIYDVWDFAKRYVAFRGMKYAEYKAIVEANYNVSVDKIVTLRVD